MTEAEKAQAGEIYNAIFDPALIAARVRTKQALKVYNDTDPADLSGRDQQLRSLFGQAARRGRMCGAVARVRPLCH